MLRIELAGLRAGPVGVAGSLAADAPVLDGLDFRIEQPVTVRGRLTDAGQGQYYLRAALETLVAVACRRCLRDIRVAVAPDVHAMFTTDSDTDDASAYVISASTSGIELDEMIREQLILAVPDYPVCVDDCLGLCAQCGNDLNEGPCACRPEPDPRWAVLEAMKTQGNDKEN